MESLTVEHARCANEGYSNVGLLDRRSVELIEPGVRSGQVYGALHTPDSGHCEPAELAIAIARSAADHGAVIHDDAEVTMVVPVDGVAGAIANDGARFTVHTASGNEYRARQVAVASGAWPEVLRVGLGLDVPVVPVKGTIWMTAKLPRGILRHVIYTEESHMGFADPSMASVNLQADLQVPPRCTHDAAGDQLVRHAYGRQRTDGRVVFGGDRVRATAEDFEVDASGIDRHRNDVAVFLAPAIMSSAVEGSWAGLMPFALDGKLLVGEMGPLGLPGLWLATGFGPNGIMHGPCVAEMVASAITGEAALPPSFQELYDPCRASGGVTKIEPGIDDTKNPALAMSADKA
jgi:glycine/D-amino acid oxidase-like deaminating enzyme